MANFGESLLKDLQFENPEVPDYEAGIYNVPEKKPNPKDIDFEAGIYTVDKISKEMDEEFEHGSPRGETTHVKQMDAHFTWRKGELTAVTGWPQMGKTEGTLFLMLLKSFYAGWRWIVFSPENFPAKVLFDNLIHAYIGKTVDPNYPWRMNKKDYDRGKAWVNKHFIYIFPNELHTPEILRLYVEYLIKNYGPFDGTLKDPWNKMTHLFQGREDLYLASQFPQEQRAARVHNLCSIITAHPNGTMVPGPDGKLKVPNQFNISGGPMWNNMFDNILAWHRPEYLIDMASTGAQFHSHKIKFQKLVGIPGEVACNFNRATNHYEFDGASPLIQPGIQTGYQSELIIPEPKKLIPLNEAEKVAPPKFDDKPPF